MREFKKLDFPRLREYYTKYPQGYTLYESLLDILEHINEVTDVVNLTLNQWEEIETWVLNELKNYSIDQLQTWLDNGTLEEVINDALFNSKADKTELIELQNLLETELIEVEDSLALKVNSSLLPIMFDGTKTLQETIEQAVLEDRPIQVTYGDFEINENVVVNCGSRNVTIRGYGKSQSYPISRLTFRNNGVGLTLNNCQNFVLEDIDIMTQTVGESPYIIDIDKHFAVVAGSLKLKNVFIRGFNQIFTWNGGYYHTFDSVVFSHFRVALRNWYANNVTFTQCDFRNFDNVIRVETGHGPISFEQCVMEKFGGYIVRAIDIETVQAMVNITNCYIENGSTNQVEGAELPIGDASFVYGCGPVSLISNFIYTNNLNRVVYAGNKTKSVLSKGNVLYYRELPSNVLRIYINGGNLLEWADVSDVVMLQGTATSSTVLVSGLSTLIAKGTSRIYNPFTKTMEV